MVSRVTVAVLLVPVAVGAVVVSVVPNDDFFAALGVTRPDVRWDRNSVVVRDFDGGGKVDFAVRAGGLRHPMACGRSTRAFGGKTRARHLSLFPSLSTLTNQS